MSYRPAPSGAKGNTRLLKQYGGDSGSGPNARQAYASGGVVKGKANGGAALNEGLAAAGSAAKPSLSRPGRKMPGKSGKKDAKTNINIIVAGGGKPSGDGPMPPPPHPMPPPGPGPGGPLPPPGPGGPPMRKHGGAVAGLAKFAKGGKVKSFVPFAKGSRPKRAAGGRVGYDAGGAVPVGWTPPAGWTPEATQLMQAGVSAPPPEIASGAPQGFRGGPPPPGLGGQTIPPPPTDGSKAGPAGGGALPPPPMMGEGPQGFMGGPPSPMPMRRHGGSVGRFAKGGKVSKSDAAVKIADDEESFAKGGRACKREGGPAISGFDAGAGGAKGRLEKIKKYGK